MQVRLFVTTSAAALLVATGAGLAQEDTATDDMVSVSVDGTMVEVPVSLAAQACGLDEATVRANAFAEAMDTKEGGEEVTASPDPMETNEDMLSSDAAVTTGVAADGAETADGASQTDGTAAEDQAVADVANEATTAAEAGDAATGAADTATTADSSADSAIADEAAETGDELQESAGASTGAAGLAACEIDQATAEQFGFPAGG